MQSKTKGRKTLFSLIRGFSILEVVAALVVLAILVAIYFPKQKGMQDSANMVKAQSELKTIEAALETYKNNNQTYPPTTDKLVEEYLIPEVPHMLPEVLHDPFADSGTEYTYTASPDGQYYAVSSVGPDRSQTVSPVSDSGEVRSQGNTLVVSNGSVVQTDSTGAVICSAGQTKCAGVCVNLKTSATHCGMCGVACSGTTNQCVNSSCQCGDNPACSGTADTCSSGTCKCGSNAACAEGQVCSSGSCIAVLTDADNCGSVGTVCANGKTCQEGVCACESGTFNDEDNCGTCGSACTGVSDTCTSGVCTCGVNAACGANEACVESACVDLLTDEDNCGSVGTLCVGSRECTAGVCVCTAGLTECSDSCVNTQTSSTHCGACDTACAEGEMCITGTCTAVYTVTYNGNGNTGGSVPSDNGSYAEGNEATVLGNTGVLEKDGYTFGGWNTQANGRGINYAEGGTFTMGSANVTLYARWTVGTSGNVWYFNPNEDNTWENLANWTSNADGTGAQPSAIPWTTEATANDDLAPGDNYNGVTSSSSLGQAFVITGVFSGADFVNNGDIYGGTFTGEGFVNNEFVWDGTFTGAGFENNRGIQGGIFTGSGFVNNFSMTGGTFEGADFVNNGSIPNGTFTGAGFINNSEIDGGTFTGSGFENRHIISGGIFTGTDFYNVGTIYGGEFTGQDFVNHGAVWDGTFTGPGFVNGNEIYGGVFSGSDFLISNGTDFSLSHSSITADGITITIDATCLHIGEMSWVTQNDGQFIFPWAVTYDGNGHTGGEVPVDGNTYCDGMVATVSGNTGDLVRDGYTFGGWNTQADGRGTNYEEGGIFTMASANMTLYARWTTGASGNVWYFNPNEDSTWENLNNWTSNPDGTGAHPPAIPWTTADTANDDLAPGDNYNGVASSSDLGSGFAITGMFSGEDFVNNGNIYDGVFTGAGFSNSNFVGGGTFTGSDISNNCAYISGGVFTGNEFYNSACGGVGGGDFLGDNFLNGGGIFAGNFSGSGFTNNNASIYGGIFSGSGFVNNWGFIYAGIFSGQDFPILQTDFSSYPETITADGITITIDATCSNIDSLTMVEVNGGRFILPYTVTYDGNGHTGGDVPVDGDTYWDGMTVTVAGNTGTLVRTDYDYTFAGWNTQADGSGTDYAAGATFTMGSDSVILYAQWIASPGVILYFYHHSDDLWNTVSNWGMDPAVSLPAGRIPAEGDSAEVAVAGLLAEVPVGKVCAINNGEIVTNNGTVSDNWGVVVDNPGIIITNNGTVGINTGTIGKTGTH